MKQVRALLKHKGVQKSVPKEHSNTRPVRLLYVEGYINSTGYYRMILPFLELGKTADFETRITSVKKWDFTKKYTIHSETFRREDIRWADYIIFPTLLEDYRYLFTAIRVIHPKVHLVMDVTQMLDNIPKTHPDYSKVSHTDSAQFICNIRQMDVVTTPIQSLAAIYQKSKKQSQDRVTKDIDFCWLPTLISTIGLAELSFDQKTDDGIIRIGMIGSIAISQAVSYILPVLQTIKQCYTDTIELILFGWDGKNAKEKKVFKDIEMTYHKSVSFLEYYQVLEGLNLDILLIPKRSSTYDYFEDHTQFLEAAALGIPVIAAAHSSYKTVIKHGENGLLAWKLPEWEEHIRYLIEHPEFRRHLVNKARLEVWWKHAYHSVTLEYFKDIFI